MKKQIWSYATAVTVLAGCHSLATIPQDASPAIASAFVGHYGVQCDHGNHSLDVLPDGGGLLDGVKLPHVRGSGQLRVDASTDPVPSMNLTFADQNGVPLASLTKPADGSRPLTAIIGSEKCRVDGVQLPTLSWGQLLQPFKQTVSLQCRVSISNSGVSLSYSGPLALQVDETGMLRFEPSNRLGQQPSVVNLSQWPTVSLIDRVGQSVRGGANQVPAYEVDFLREGQVFLTSGALSIDLRRQIERFHYRHQMKVGGDSGEDWVCTRSTPPG